MPNEVIEDLNRSIKKTKITLNKNKSFLFKNFDKIALVASFFGPAMTAPQVYQIFTTKDASGISLLTWVGYLIVATVWTIYGILREDKLITLNNSLWFIFEIMVIIGIVLYG